MPCILGFHETLLMMMFNFCIHSYSVVIDTFIDESRGHLDQPLGNAVSLIPDSYVIININIHL